MDDKNSFEIGDRVRINKPTLREHRRIGVVQYYDFETRWFSVELENGPPWRGKYEYSELEDARREP